ncbi:mitochondrial genome maintenance MGM101 [Schizopora paradoxa]|uniref:Mitochondrial genome maintenance protein MGM101 n=1 Tax=Schizopora paradoxa TaxID=27342 RepID=A0A0H2RG63_9AGAM|nr:mitochondrial genome maintenance MGM101 [Schizopora paradoxa]
MASYAFRTAAGLTSSLRVGLRSQLLRTRFSLRFETAFVPSRLASTSTIPGRGNPETVNTLPNTADEVEISEELLKASNGRGKSSAPPSPPKTQFPTEGLDYTGDGSTNDWSKSYFGLSVEPFSKEVSDILQAPIDPLDIEVKPDGLLYLPEIKYRRILNKAFGPGGWGLAPRSDTNVGPKVVSREYALVCLGRLVGVARGEQDYFDASGIPTATEAVKSNALMRCCKDLGVASELWDPRFIREFKAKHCVEVFAQNASTKAKKKLWRRKDQPKFEYPWKE